MNSRSSMCLWRALAVLLLTLLASGSAEAASGFTMYFVGPESGVSGYQDESTDYSVSLGYPVYPHISFQLKRRPDLVASSFDNDALRFNTVYFRRGAATYSLIPVSVDAKTYNAFRRRFLRDQEFDQMAIGTLKQGQAGRAAGGLGLTVDLPKRLENIFGEGGAGLRVSGYRKIIFSGRSQWTDAAESPAYTQSKFPSLNMEQIYQFDITGTIGSKITVKVSQDSHTDIPLANRIQIRYKGDDDDVLKTIEAGNTNLSLPNTQFVGYSSQIRGLFGVKAEAQLGSLYLTAIASQEKGSSERTTVTPTGEESARIVRDYDYAERKIFDLGGPGDFATGDSVKLVLAYQQIQGGSAERPTDAVYANLLVDPDNPDDYKTENQLLSSGTEGVVPIDPLDYYVYSTPSKNEHYIVFTSRLRDYSVGIWMEVRRANGTFDTVGVDASGTDTDPKILKLLYSKAAQPSYRSWNYMWRNVYDVPPNTEIEDLDVKVYKGLTGSENNTNSVEFQTDSSGATEKYIELLGLDQYNGNNLTSFAPDGKIDAESPAIYRKEWGVIIFPSRRPFADTAITFRNGATQPLLDPVPQIYAYESPTMKTQSSKYFLKFFTKSRSSEIRLGRPNIIEGSERVTANGVPLTKGTDYRIDYDLGRVTLMSAQATDPNADIGIDFEYAPFLAVQKKTLLGFRAEYEFNRNFKMGSTVLYKSDKAQDRKPRVGQETAKSVVFDVDATLQLQPNFLTRLADALPIVKTESPSNLRLSGELAQSHPNPNVEGVAYIDDFEASTEQTGLGIGRTQWQRSSKPYQLSLDPEATWRRGKLLWHNPEQAVKLTDIYEKREARAGESTIQPLRFIFRPTFLDTTWNWMPDPDDSNDSIPVPAIDTVPTQPHSWAGIMRYFKGRIDAERVQLFEMRARGRTGKMHLEFGRISEDVNGDGRSTGFEEDRYPVGTFTTDEDVGFDTLPDERESEFYDPVYNPDPNHDDWYYPGTTGDIGPKCPLPGGDCSEFPESMRYDFLNGTEGNAIDPESDGLGDEENLGGTFEQQNGYFSYVIDFSAPSPFRVDSSRWEGTDPDPGGNPQPPWYTYRIPIRDSLFVDTVVIENTTDTLLIPRWNGDRITHCRIWFESEPGKKTPDTVEVADWYFVQTSWRDTVEFGPQSTGRTRLEIASISEEDGTFSPPDGVTAYKDPTTNVTESQRGLMLRVKSLDSRDIAEVRKQALTVDKYAGYGALEMYVHGKLTGTADGDLQLYFRLGRDSTNYYEQRKIVHEGWDERNYIKIKFDDITALKDAAQRDRDRQTWKDVDTLNADSSLRVRGDPSLNEVKYFAVGLTNTRGPGQSNEVDSAEIWLDELRVTDVRRDVGTAARFSASGNIADLGTYNFAYQSQDPYFRGLSSSTRGGSDQNLGSGQTDTRMQYSMSLNIDRFLPRSWNARLPVQFSYAKSTQIPLLRTGSDIVLPEEIRQKERTVAESRTFSVSPSFNRPGKNPLFSLLLNRLEGTSVSYRRSLQRSPRTPFSFNEGLNVRSGYNFGIKAKPTAPILFFTKWIPILNKLSDTKLGLYPTSWRVNGSFDRSLTITDDVSNNRRSSFKRTLDARMDAAYDLFQNLTLNMRLDTRRDLSEDKDVDLSLSHLKLGLETHFGQTFGAKYSPRILSWFSTDWTYNTTYTEDWDRSSESSRSSLSRSWGVGGAFDHIKLLGGKGSGSSERRFRGGRGRGRRDTEAEKKTDNGRPFYDPPLAVLRFLTGWINSPRYSYSESFKYSLPGMVTRPGLNYRLGFSRTPGVDLVSSTYNPDAGEGKSYDVTSGFNLLGGITTDIKFRRSITTDLIKRGNLYESINTSWPDLTIRIQRFQKLPLIKGVLNKFIDIFSPRTGFSRSTRKTTDLAGGFVTAESENISQNPLLSLNFKLFRSLSLSTSLARTRENSTDYSRTTGVLQSKSSTVRNTIGGTAQYSFTAPGGIKMPLFGRLKFRSTVNFSLDIKYNKSLTENEDANGRLISSTTRSDMVIRPDISYTFSQQIRGGLSMRWSDSNSSNRTNHLREVQMWMEIRF